MYWNQNKILFIVIVQVYNEIIAAAEYNKQHKPKIKRISNNT